MNEVYFADSAGSVINFRNSPRLLQPDMDCHIHMIAAELEELIADIRNFMQHARRDNDAFEYYRLCEELRLAEAARHDN